MIISSSVEISCDSKTVLPTHCIGGAESITYQASAICQFWHANCFYFDIDLTHWCLLWLLLIPMHIKYIWEDNLMVVLYYTNKNTFHHSAQSNVTKPSWVMKVFPSVHYIKIVFSNVIFVHACHLYLLMVCIVLQKNQKSHKFLYTVFMVCGRKINCWETRIMQEIAVAASLNIIA